MGPYFVRETHQGKDKLLLETLLFESDIHHLLECMSKHLPFPLLTCCAEDAEGVTFPVAGMNKPLSKYRALLTLGCDRFCSCGWEQAGMWFRAVVPAPFPSPSSAADLGAQSHTRRAQHLAAVRAVLLTLHILICTEIVMPFLFLANVLSCQHQTVLFLAATPD